MHACKIPALGIWVQVPHYVSAMPYPAASVALLDGLTEVTGIEVAAADLRAAVGPQRQRIDASIEDNDDHATMLRQLEEMHDASTDGEVTPVRRSRCVRATNSPTRSSSSSATRTEPVLRSFGVGSGKTGRSLGVGSGKTDGLASAP